MTESSLQSSWLDSHLPLLRRNDEAGSSRIVKRRQLSPGQALLAECFECFGGLFVVAYSSKKPHTVTVFRSGGTLDLHERVAGPEAKTLQLCRLPESGRQIERVKR